MLCNLLASDFAYKARMVLGWGHFVPVCDPPKYKNKYLFQNLLLLISVFYCVPGEWAS